MLRVASSSLVYRSKDKRLIISLVIAIIGLFVLLPPQNTGSGVSWKLVGQLQNPVAMLKRHKPKIRCIGGNATEVETAFMPSCNMQQAGCHQSGAVETAWMPSLLLQPQNFYASGIRLDAFLAVLGSNVFQNRQWFEIPPMCRCYFIGLQPPLWRKGA